MLDQIILQKEYAHRGNTEAESWIKGSYHFDHLFSKSAKKLAKEIISQRASDWWRKGGWTSERRK